MCNCTPLTDEEKASIAMRFLSLPQVDCKTRQLREEAFKSRSANYNPELLTDAEIVFDAWLRNLTDLARIGQKILDAAGIK